jgi:hypothetical protein
VIHTATHPDPTRKPVAWLNYSADVRDAVCQTIGPNLLREVYVIVVVEYDDETGKSRVGVAHAHTSDIAAQPLRVVMA